MRRSVVVSILILFFLISTLSVLGVDKSQISCCDDGLWTTENNGCLEGEVPQSAITACENQECDICRNDKNCCYDLTWITNNEACFSTESFQAGVDACEAGECTACADNQNPHNPDNSDGTDPAPFDFENLGFDLFANECEEPITVKLAVVVFDPIVGDQSEKLSSFMEWTNPSSISNQYITLIETVTNDCVKFEKTEIEVDGFPLQSNPFGPDKSSFEITLEEYINLETKTVVLQSEGFAVYDETFESVVTNFDACNYDHVWLFGGPKFGFADFFATGNIRNNVCTDNDCLATNGKPENYQPPVCDGKSTFYNAFNYKDSVDIDRFISHIDSILSWTLSSANSGSIPSESKYTEFTSVGDGANTDIAFCGNINSPPNSGYEGTDTKLSYCENYHTFPDITSVDPSEIGCEAWGCTKEGFHIWWLDHLPHTEGGSVDTFTGKTIMNNWWHYIYNYDNLELPLLAALHLTFDEPSPTPTDYGGTFVNGELAMTTISYNFLCVEGEAPTCTTHCSECFPEETMLETGRSFNISNSPDLAARNIGDKLQWTQGGTISAVFKINNFGPRGCFKSGPGFQSCDLEPVLDVNCHDLTVLPKTTRYTDTFSEACTGLTGDDGIDANCVGTCFLPKNRNDENGDPLVPDYDMLDMRWPTIEEATCLVSNKVKITRDLGYEITYPPGNLNCCNQPDWRQCDPNDGMASYQGAIACQAGGCEICKLQGIPDEYVLPTSIMKSETEYYGVNQDGETVTLTIDEEVEPLCIWEKKRCQCINTATHPESYVGLIGAGNNDNTDGREYCYTDNDCNEDAFLIHLGASGGGGSGTSYSFGLHPEGDNVRLFARFNRVGESTYPNWDDIYSNEFPKSDIQDQWVNAVMIYDTEHVIFLLNGIEVGKVPFTGDLLPANSVEIGSQSIYDHFNGLIDDLKVYLEPLSPDTFVPPPTYPTYLYCPNPDEVLELEEGMTHYDPEELTYYQFRTSSEESYQWDRDVGTNNICVTDVSVIAQCEVQTSCVSGGTSEILSETNKDISVDTLGALSGTGAEEVDWVDLEKAKEFDSEYATIELSENKISNGLIFNNFKFDIPAEATITGVTVTMQKKADSDNTGTVISDSFLKLNNGNGDSNENRAKEGDAAWPSQESEIIYGSTNDLWGLTLTPSTVNDDSFSLIYHIKGVSGDSSRTASLDGIKITVHYSLQTNSEPTCHDPNTVLDVDGDGEFEVCLARESVVEDEIIQGGWVDPDAFSDYCNFVNDALDDKEVVYFSSCEADGSIKPGCLEGTNDFLGIDFLSEGYCCGDDASEFVARSDAFSQESQIACCDAPTDCVDNTGHCRETGFTLCHDEKGYTCQDGTFVENEENFCIASCRICDVNGDAEVNPEDITLLTNVVEQDNVQYQKHFDTNQDNELNDEDVQFCEDGFIDENGDFVVATCEYDCTIESATLEIYCTDDVCSTGQELGLNLETSGECPRLLHVQIDASSDDCTLEYDTSVADIQGIFMQCNDDECGRWVVPEIPEICSGDEISTSIMAIWRQGYPTDDNAVVLNEKSGSIGSFTLGEEFTCPEDEPWCVATRTCTSEPCNTNGCTSPSGCNPNDCTDCSNSGCCSQDSCIFDPACFPSNPPGGNPGNGGGGNECTPTNSFEICDNNGVDDDCKNGADCADSACSSHQSCGGGNGGYTPTSSVEICDNNGVDDDCKNGADCADSACSSHQSCGGGNGGCTPTSSVEICDNNGVDDDCQNGADCNDSSCESHNSCTSGPPGCTATGVEICDNDGVDDDCDGFEDCKDETCFLNPACITNIPGLPGTPGGPGGNPCADGTCSSEVDCGCENYGDCPASECTNECPGETEICNNGGVDDDCDGFEDCKDETCFLDPVCITNIPGLPGTPNACADGTCSEDVDCECEGYGDCTASQCSASCVPSQEICNDEKDNDCDGFVDCNDLDCSQSTFCVENHCIDTTCNFESDCSCESLGGCTELECANGCQSVLEICDDDIDNDCDGFEDCDDETCRTQEICLFDTCSDFTCTSEDCSCESYGDCTANECKSCESEIEICNDDIDNDCDGFIDCFDETCFSSCQNHMCSDTTCSLGQECSLCEENGDCTVSECTNNCVESTELCSDDIDNDCDGFIDCDDETCFLDSSCQTGTPPSNVCADQTCNSNQDCSCESYGDCTVNECQNTCTPTTEICDDNKDNDCDGFIDCFDTQDCKTHDICINNVCNDLTCDQTKDCLCDDNGDCAASQCVNACEPVLEVCNDNIDNDCDGFIDCDDETCFGTCENNVCSDTSCDLDQDCSCQGYGDCTMSQCVQSCEATLEICDDNKDNDCDGFIDCEDETCYLNNACELNVCSDGHCGNTDCGCQAYGDCSYDKCVATCSVEVCGDGLDNDCDGFVDCADETCFLSPQCQEDICFDNECVVSQDCGCQAYGDCTISECLNIHDTEVGVSIIENQCNYEICAFGFDDFYHDINITITNTGMLELVSARNFDEGDTLIEEENKIIYNPSVYNEQDCIIITSDSLITFDITIDDEKNNELIYLEEDAYHPSSIPFSFAASHCSTECSSPAECGTTVAIIGKRDCDFETCSFVCGGYWQDTESEWDGLFGNVNPGDYCSVCSSDTDCSDYNNEQTCNQDPCQGSLSQLGCSWNNNTNICEDLFSPCPPGTKLCDDGTCKNSCDTMGCFGSSDGICELGEGCDCIDCLGLQGSCTNGTLCSSDGLCGCPLGTTMCDDGSCSNECIVNSACDGPADDVCSFNEGCACIDCQDERGICMPHLICNSNHVECVTFTNISCPEGTTLCNDFTCDSTCFNNSGRSGCINQPNQVCEIGEGCACSDCASSSLHCEGQSYCNFNTQLCYVTPEPDPVKPDPCIDNDGDGYFASSTSCYNGNDCNDNNKKINVGARDICNDIDDNCNGQIDEDCVRDKSIGIKLSGRMQKAEILNELIFIVEVQNTLDQAISHIDISLDIPNKFSLDNNKQSIPLLNPRQTTTLTFKGRISDYKSTNAKITIISEIPQSSKKTEKVDSKVTIPSFLIRPLDITKNTECTEYYYIINNNQLSEIVDVEMEILTKEKIFPRNVVVDYVSNINPSEDVTIEPMNTPFCLSSGEYIIKGYLYEQGTSVVTTAETSEFEIKI